MSRTSQAYDLSATEKRDLIKLIEQGKPLPERYRFLLFEDKREVELVWNGKTREVCTAVLPFQTLEHIDEPRKEKREDEELGRVRCVRRSETDRKRRGRSVQGEHQIIMSARSGRDWSRAEVECSAGAEIAGGGSRKMTNNQDLMTNRKGTNNSGAFVVQLSVAN